MSSAHLNFEKLKDLFFYKNFFRIAKRTDALQ